MVLGIMFASEEASAFRRCLLQTKSPAERGSPDPVARGIRGCLVLDHGFDWKGAGMFWNFMNMVMEGCFKQDIREIARHNKK